MEQPTSTSSNVFSGIRRACREGRYWSITTMPSPFAPWSPLPAHGEMETRRCHCSQSRVHRLRCGHLVAVPREAEKCAPNCAGMDMNAIIQGNMFIPAGEKDRQPGKTPQEIANDSMKGLVAYAGTFLNPQTTEGAQTAMELKMIMDRMSFVQQKEHQPDLTKGDFQCKECGTAGARPSVPAFLYRVDPWHIIIPVRNNEDAAVVEALRKGQRPKPPNRGQHNRKKGNGRPPKNKVQDGRITKQRV